ncbi:MAG: hypothetical protein LBR19_04725 [Bifidobacteriaceae bacterium]|jgi:predicted transcriptional regulator|nr:hypothetical protein [Bifidobacteriaceae bacterium]
MRTTIDLPDDLRQQVLSIATDNHESLSKAAVRLIASALGTARPARVFTDPATGEVLLDVGRRVTTEDVRSLEDDL